MAVPLCVLRVPHCRKKALQVGVRQCDELCLAIYEGSPVSFTVMKKNDKLVSACFAYSTLSFILLLLCVCLLGAWAAPLRASRGQYYSR